MRLERLDILRGIAIIGMIAFHLNYSLVYIFDSEILNISESFWYILGRFSALSFILIAGFSYFLAEQKYQKAVQKKYIKYALVLSIIALAISLITFFFIPKEFIVFGILHFFALSFFLLPFVSKLGYGVFPLGIIVILYGIFFIPFVENPFLFPLGFHTRYFVSADYYPLFPYFGVLLLGYGLGKIAHTYSALKYLQILRKNYFWERVLIYLGKRSLILYLIHQPIIVSVLFVLKYLGMLGK